MPFSQKSLSFLIENRVVDNKVWFLEHHTDYETYVLEPMRELVTALTPMILDIDPYMICQPKIGRSISRIYRDTRFSHDKSIFRDVMWCVFIRQKKLYNGLPGFFFEFSPRGFRYGCGYYETSVDSMNAIRGMILDNEKSYKSALKAYRSQPVFHMENTKYKRSRFPDQPEEKREWLDQRSLGFITDSDDLDLLFSDTLAEKLAEDFRLLIPIYEFMMVAEARVPKRQP